MLGCANGQADPVRDMGSLLSYCPSGWTLGPASQAPCIYQDPSPLSYRKEARFSIPIPVNATFDLSIQVASIDGNVDVKLLGPDGSTQSTSNERIGEDTVAVQRSVLGRLPGNWTLVLTAVGDEFSVYQVTVQGMSNVPRLAASEVALMKSIIAQCCSSDDDILPDSCNRLKRATAAGAKAEDDLCSQPPTMCNATGHLTKLVLSGGDQGNFICPTFPTELGQLAALQVLDWSFNRQVGTLAHVAQVLAPLAGRLRRLYLNSNSLSGQLDCALVQRPGLELLWLDYNLLVGSVPACYFSSPTLQQLSAYNNFLSGALPPVPAGCNLATLDLGANGPPDGPSAGNPGLTGTIPNTLVNAVKLRYLDLSSNSLTGTIPPVPSSLQVLQATDNGLVGSIPASLDDAIDLRVLDLSRNRLTGTLSDSITNNGLLTVLRLAHNSLEGELPVDGWSENLLDVDLSSNRFSGARSRLWYQPSLVRLNLAANNFTMNIKELATGLAANRDTPNNIMYFNISRNRIHGSLEAGLSNMKLFKVLFQDSGSAEALGAAPPMPYFDISHNLIHSPFPKWLLPPLGQLMYESDYDWIPLNVSLQPQLSAPAAAPDGSAPGLLCPGTGETLPERTYYLPELEQQYNLTCTTGFGLLINISRFNDMSLQPALPPKPPAPPSPPPMPPPRRRRSTLPPAGVDPAAQSPAAAGGDGGGGDGGAAPAPSPDAAAGGSGDRGLPTPADGNADGGNGSPSGGSPSEGSGKKGGGVGAIVGAVVGVLVGLLLLGLLGWYLWKRHAASKQQAARRVPLTHNATYEAASEGTASNYGDLQMFAFNANEKPARHRARMA